MHLCFKLLEISSCLLERRVSELLQGGDFDNGKPLYCSRSTGDTSEVTVSIFKYNVL